MNQTNSIALLFIAVGVLFFFGKPIVGEITTLQAKQTEYEEAVTKVLSINSMTKEMNAKVENIPAEDKQRIEMLVTDSIDMTKLVSDIAGVASRYGIAIDDVGYTGIANTSSAPSVAEASTPQGYNSSMVEFSFSSNYLDLKSFLSDLEASLRIIDIRSVKFTQNTEGKYSYKVGAEIYWLSNDNKVVTP